MYCASKYRKVLTYGMLTSNTKLSYGICAPEIPQPEHTQKSSEEENENMSG